MSSSTLDNAELLLHSTKDNWNNSLDSILTQKILKITKSESLFQFSDNFNPNLTLSELELRETYIKNFKSKQANWEMIQETRRPPRAVQTKALLRDELEMLKINLSVQDKTVFINDCDNFVSELNKRGRKFSKLIKTLRNSNFIHLKGGSRKVRDLLTEIDGEGCDLYQTIVKVKSYLAFSVEMTHFRDFQILTKAEDVDIAVGGSESAKTDVVIWKFLKRGPSFRREYINARKLFTELQALSFPDLVGLSISRFQNTRPIRITCPNCGFFINTRTKKVSTVRTKLTSLVLAIIGLCFIPQVIYAFKDTVHLCPLCKIYLGFCPAFGLWSGRKALNLYKASQQHKLSNESVLVGNDEKILLEEDSDLEVLQN